MGHTHGRKHSMVIIGHTGAHWPHDNVSSYNNYYIHLAPIFKKSYSPVIGCIRLSFE